jgi:hypothetical protein
MGKLARPPTVAAAWAIAAEDSGPYRFVTKPCAAVRYDCQMPDKTRRTAGCDMIITLPHRTDSPIARVRREYQSGGLELRIQQEVTKLES